MGTMQLLMLFCVTTAFGMPEISDPSFMKTSPLENMKLELAQHIKETNPAFTDKQWEELNAILVEFEKNFLFEIEKIVDRYAMANSGGPFPRETPKKEEQVNEEFPREFINFKRFLLENSKLNEDMAREITKALQINLMKTRFKMEDAIAKFKENAATKPTM